MPSYEYYKTPLRAASDAQITSQVTVDRMTRTFTGLARGDSSDNPTDPQLLTDEQASKGVQFFFRPRLGYIEATFSVSYTGSDATCEGRNLMFAGDSALCAPPPPSAR